MREGSSKAREISLGKDFSDVAVKVNGVRVEVHTDGSILAYTNGRVDAYTNGPVQVHPAANDDDAAKCLASTLPAEWRAAFYQFLETGEADKPFLDYLESDKAAQTAIEAAFKRQAAALEGLGALLRSPKTDDGIGEEMPDGTILAGFYEGKPLYATPKDAPGTYTFNEAAKYAKNLDAHGHHDFHAPSKGELNVLFETRNKGKLAGTFNETGSYPAAWYWSSSQVDGGYASDQRFSDGT